MKNLLKSSFSILIALTVLLCGISAFADDADTGEAHIPTFEIGSGISGMLLPEGIKVKAHVSRNGQARFTLTLTEDCGIRIDLDGSSAALTRPNTDLPVYTFTNNFEQKETCVISMSADREIGYAITSEILPEIPAPEADQEETTEEVSAPVEEATEASREESPEEPVEGPAKESAEEPAEDQKFSEENPGEDQKEITEEEKDKEELEEASAPSENNTDPNQPDTITEDENKETDPEALPGDVTPEIEDNTEQTEHPETLPESGIDSEKEILSPDEETSQKDAENQEDPTLLNQDEPGENETGPEDVEVIINTAVQPGDVWEKTVKRSKPAVLKLDLAEETDLHLVLEGKDVWCSVQKSDVQTEDVNKVLTDPETKRVIIEWHASGSYLITIGAGEESLMARVKATFMDNIAFEQWLSENNIPEELTDEDTTTGTEETDEKSAETTEPEETEETAGTPDTDHAEETDEETFLPEDRSVTFEILWDTEDPVIGDTAHLVAKLSGYEEANYSLQWQYSLDDSTWIDVPEATSETLDVVTTDENNLYYWRVMVYVYTPEDNEE